MFSVTSINVGQRPWRTQDGTNPGKQDGQGDDNEVEIVDKSFLVYAMSLNWINYIPDADSVE